MSLQCILLWLGPAALVAIVIIALFRAFPAAPRIVPGKDLEEASVAEAAGVEDALAVLVRRPTVSCYDRSAEDEGAFSAFKADLIRLFPLVHGSLGREEIGDRGLLFTWRGTDAELKPALLCAHFDVVPADDAAEWRHGPFSGDIAEGCVWGRGTQDIKLSIAAMLHAAERLLKSGFRPRRTLYFAFGGDEELEGERGAGRIAQSLAERGVRAGFLLDEGGPIAAGMISFADRPLALIGIAEKGCMDVRVEVRGAGGHASMPPRKTAVGELASAIHAIESSPPRSRLNFTVRSFLGKLAPYSGLPYRLLFRNLWLFGGLVRMVFGLANTTNAMIRTTYALTMLRGSSKENVLADLAFANVNVRILPGESSSEVLRRLERLCRPYGASVSLAHPGSLVEALAESSVDTEGYRAIVGALSASFPEAAAVPFLFSARTDTKHYRTLVDAMYRLTPLRQTAGQLEGIHGRDERVEIGNLRRCELFYKSLLERL
jgi:carboxypeptidase PM20D1